MNYSNIKGKVALITGGSRGIGSAIAKRLASDGAKVAVNYSQSSEMAEKIVDGIKQAGGEAIAVQADVSKPDQIPQMFSKVMDTYGKLDILVNNAGTMQRAPLNEVTVEQIDKHLNLNVRGYLLCAKHASELLKSGGCIVNISSAITRMAYPGAVVYSMTKGAIDVMTRVLAAELGPKGIRVNTIAPGSTVTDMNSRKSGKSKEEEQWEIDQTALRELGDTDDIADAVAFICSNDARWLTGAWLDVSGGLRL